MAFPYDGFYCPVAKKMIVDLCECDVICDVVDHVLKPTALNPSIGFTEESREVCLNCEISKKYQRAEFQ